MITRAGSGREGERIYDEGSRCCRWYRRRERGRSSRRRSYGLEGRSWSRADLWSKYRSYPCLVVAAEEQSAPPHCRWRYRRREERRPWKWCVAVWASLLTEWLKSYIFRPILYFYWPKIFSYSSIEPGFGLGKCQLEFEGVVKWIIWNIYFSFIIYTLFPFN